MEDKDREFLASFAEKLEKTLVDQCTADELLDGKILEVEELDEKWRTSAPEYMVDAVPQIAQYPAAAIAWACYVGMGAAVLWDKSWGEYKDVEDWYTLMAKPRGFDCLDEYVREEVLLLKDEAFVNMEKLVGECASRIHNALLKQQFEPGTKEAFHGYVACLHQLYLMGMAMQLNVMGYHMTKMDV